MIEERKLKSKQVLDARFKDKKDIKCYLCGQPIEVDSNVDHVPAESIFPKNFRKNKNLDNLITLPTHLKCNESFHLDEEYFRDNLAVYAEQETVGSSLWLDVSNSHNKKLAENRTKYSGYLVNEYDVNNVGLHKSNKKRIDNVIWKISRGLFYFHFGTVINDDVQHICLLFPENNASDIWEKISWQNSLGKYPEAFDYQVIHDDSKDESVFIFAFRFWDAVNALSVFKAQNVPA